VAVRDDLGVGWKGLILAFDLEAFSYCKLTALPYQTKLSFEN